MTQILTNKKKLFFVDYAPGHFWQYQFVLTFFKSSVFKKKFKKRQAVDSILQFGKRALFIFFICILESMTMQGMAKIETRKKINADYSSETPARASDLRRCRGEGVVKERPNPQLDHGMGEVVVLGLQEDSALGPKAR